MPVCNRRVAKDNELTQMQWYLGEETVEDWEDGIISRRAMLKRLIVICGGSAAAAAVLAACGVPASAPTAAPSTAAPAQPTTAPTEVAATTPTEAPTSAPTEAATVAATVATTSGATAEATSAQSTPAATAATTGATSPLSVAADDSAVTTSDVSWQSDTEVKGYLARPSAEGIYPGVIVVHENRGLTDHIRDVARRLAKAGFVALAPDLVSRMGGTASMGADQVASALAGAKPEDLVKDLSTGVDFLLSQSGVVPDKAGVVGFCFGGAYTLRLAATNPKIAAAVPYYGVTPDPAAQMANTNAAIMAQYGGTDTRVNSTIPALEDALKAAGKTFEKHIYDGAGHAFNNDTGTRYNEAAAVQAWQRTVDWFTKYLGE